MEKQVNGDRAATSKLRVDRTTANIVLLTIFGILLVGYIINAMDRTSFPVYIPDVRNQYGFTLGEGGLLATISNLGIGIAGFPAGYLITRISKKHLFNIGLFVFSAATLLTIVAAALWDMLIYRIFTGIGESLQLTALFTIAGVLFSRYRGAALGAVNTAFAVGSFIGPALGGALLDRYANWHVPMIVFALIGFAAFIGTLFVPSRIVDRRVTEPIEIKVEGGDQSILNRNMYILIPATALGGLVTFGFLGMYPSFLQNDLKYSAGTAGLMLSFSGIGALVSLLGGLIGDRFNLRNILVLSYLLTAAGGIIMFTGPTDPVSQGILSFLQGVFFSGIVYVNLASSMVKSVEQRLAGLASGIFMTSLYIPAAFAGYLIGSMASSWGWGAAGVIQIGAFSVVGAILCAFLKPTRFSHEIQYGDRKIAAPLMK